MRRAPLRPNNGNEYSGGAIAKNGYADPPPRSRPRQTSVLEVPCLDCDRDVGEPCVSAKGTPTKTPHMSRRRMATRLDNEKREAEGTLKARDPLDRTPGSREDLGGPECTTCGLRIKKVKNRDGRWSLAVHTAQGQQPSEKHRACPESGRVV